MIINIGHAARPLSFHLFGLSKTRHEATTMSYKKLVAFILFLFSMMLMACGTLEVGVESEQATGADQTRATYSDEPAMDTTNAETAGDPHAEITIGTPAPQRETMPTAPPFRLGFGLVELLIIACAGGLLLTGAISVIYVVSRARQRA